LYLYVEAWGFNPAVDSQNVMIMLFIFGFWLLSMMEACLYYLPFWDRGITKKSFRFMWYLYFFTLVALSVSYMGGGWSS
jgi:hypothetical protein